MARAHGTNERAAGGVLRVACAEACTTSLGVLPSPRTRLFGRWVLSLVFAFAVCAYLESGILSAGLPSLKGKLTLYTDLARGLKDAAVWAGVFAAAPFPKKVENEGEHGKSL